MTASLVAPLLVFLSVSPAFAQKQQLTTDILLAEIRGTQPLSVTRAEDIQGIRDWAKARAVPAD